MEYGPGKKKSGDPSGSVISVACDHSGRVLHPGSGRSRLREMKKVYR